MEKAIQGFTILMIFFRKIYSSRKFRFSVSNTLYRIIQELLNFHAIEIYCIEVFFSFSATLNADFDTLQEVPVDALLEKTKTHLTRMEKLAKEGPPTQTKTGKLACLFARICHIQISKYRNLEEKSR